MRPTFLLRFFLILSLFFLASFPPPEASGREKTEEGLSLAYKTTIGGSLDSSTRQVLTRLSATVELEDRPPLTLPQLHRRAQEDVDEFTRAMRSMGFYASQISYEVDAEEKPVKVRFQIDPGPPFVIREVVFKNLDKDTLPPVTLPRPEKLGLIPGRRMEAPAVLAARGELDKVLRAQGYPFPQSQIQEVIVDHADHTARISLAFAPGASAVFGDTQVSGLSRVKPAYVLERVPWKKGEAFTAPKMDEFRRKLSTSGLFTVVEINHPDALSANRELPVFVKVTERKPRTARAGFGYQTDIGLQGQLGWTHRNLWGEGENLDLRLSLSKVLQSLEGELSIPGFLHPDQRLIFKSGVVNEEQDAYDSLSWYVTSAVERQVTRELSLNAGIGYRVTRIEQQDEKSELGLLFFPMGAIWDNRDDILDPARGIRLNLRVTPFIDTWDPKTKFITLYGSLSHYLQLWPKKRLILANRIALGTITAESLLDVPADERFYAGGGGSVRGYSYQSAGNLENEDPVGGLSLAEINSELRFKVTERQGLVAFVDGGRAFDSSTLDFNESLFWGWGLGYRFYTDFGPIRADVAFPLNRRKGIDDSFQIYISIGQAF